MKKAITPGLVAKYNVSFVIYDGGKVTKFYLIAETIKTSFYFKRMCITLMKKILKLIQSL